MRVHRHTAALLTGVVAVIVAVALFLPCQARAASYDSPVFYTSAPAGWQHDAVGTLLKYQYLPHTWPCLHGLRAYRIMYVSRGATDGFSHGGRVYETGMVYIPASADVPEGGWPIVAWGHGTSGVGPSAAPSRYPWLYPEPLKWAWDEYAVFVGEVGRLGAIVTCPDYEGLGTYGSLSTYWNINAMGRSMIDAVRAARHLALVLGVPASTSWAATGHSQGVGAAIGAAQLATTYGKGLRLRATVGFAPGSGVAHALTSIYTDPNWYPYLGYMAWGMKAIDTHHQFTFADLLGPWILPHINGARHLYFDYWWQLLQSAHWSGSYPNGTPLTPTVADVLAPGWQNNPVVKRWLRDRTIGLRRAVRPVLVVQGTADTLYPNFPELKAQLKHAGDRVKYVLLAGRDHDQAVPYGWPAAKAFLERYLFGR